VARFFNDKIGKDSKIGLLSIVREIKGVVDLVEDPSNRDYKLRQLFSGRC